MPNDTQLIELAGRHWLIGQLLTFGLEVADPIRDRGVDLIVYEDRADTFRAVPVQLKVASHRAFGIHRKYDKTRDLLLAYIWNIRPGETPSAYVLRLDEAIALGDEMGYTKTPSWAKGAYTTTKPSMKLIKKLERFASSADRWRMLLQRGRARTGS